LLVVFLFEEIAVSVSCFFRNQKKQGDKKATMNKHETKHCPRCKTSFECKVGDIIRCQCQTVTLLPETTLFLSNTNFDCLCAVCLSDFNDMQSKSAKLTFPKQKEQLIEGLHYYKENGNWVFTEFYHFSRGTCCQSGCRHCVYGFQRPPELLKV